MKSSFLVLTLLTALTLNAQLVTNVILVNGDSVTNDITKAESFIIIKQFPKTFERLDYKKDGPMLKLRSYKDSNLAVLEGRYFEYRLNGTMLYEGNYKDNEKSGDWLTYNDTGKAIRHLKYEKNLLMATIDHEIADTTLKYGDEREAELIGGKQKWKTYLGESVSKGTALLNSLFGGTVIVIFTIDTTGQVASPFISKSVDFAIDEEVIQIITDSPKWLPAWQNGHPIKAFLRQPLTYRVPTDK